MHKTWCQSLMNGCALSSFFAEVVGRYMECTYRTMIESEKWTTFCKMMTTILQIIVHVYDQVTDELEIPVGEQHRITFTSRYNSQGSTYPWTFLSLLISKSSSQVEPAKPAPSIPATIKLRIPSGEHQWTKNWAVAQLNHTLYCQFTAHRNALAVLHPFVPLASPMVRPPLITKPNQPNIYSTPLRSAFEGRPKC